MPTKRNIKVAATVKKPAAKVIAPQRKIVVAAKAPPKKAAPVQVAAPSSPARRSRSDRVTYGDLPVTYTGMSPYVNKRPSKTVIPVAEFGSKPSMTLHQRTELALKDWKARFGNRPFQRGNLDAGVLKLLGWRGFIRHVDGDPASDKCQFVFTRDGLEYHVA